jgi:hypothetical protein
MKRSIILFFAIFATSLNLMAQSGEEWLAKLSRSLGERYAMSMSVAMGSDMDDLEEQVSGYIMVEGDSYYITLGIMEVYSDGVLRYEINNERKEVTEDRVNLSSHDLLTNPTRAFLFAPEEFDITLRFSHNGEIACLELSPHDAALGVTTITLVLVSEGDNVYPSQIAYDYDGDLVCITLYMVDVQDKSLPRWNKDNYRAYDIVSFL